MQMIDDHRQRGTKPFNSHQSLEIVTDQTLVTWKNRTS